jgi:hypothetical protein
MELVKETSFIKEFWNFILGPIETHPPFLAKSVNHLASTVHNFMLTLTTKALLFNI